jgi:chlorobactene glucosyltransferase
MEQQDLDFVSLFPRLHCVSVIENVNVPAYVGGFCQLVGEVVRPGSGRAFGAGALMLARRTALEASGGIAGVKAEMLDDIALASQIRRSGFKVGFWAGSNLVDVRFFKGNWHALWGLTKNVLAEFSHQMWIGPIALLVPILVFWSPWVAMGLGITTQDWLLVALGAGTYLLQYLLMAPFHEIVCFHRGKVLFFPLIAIVLICCYVRASFHYFVRGAVYWRGRSIRVRGAAQ